MLANALNKKAKYPRHAECMSKKEEDCKDPCQLTTAFSTLFSTGLNKICLNKKIYDEENYKSSNWNEFAKDMNDKMFLNLLNFRTLKL